MLALTLWSAPAGAANPEDGRRAYDAGHFTDAMGIWSELSRQGNAEAEFGMGLLYDLGNGMPENADLAFSYYKMAAEAGLPAAEFNVGAMYDSGRGVAQSSRNAALWYAKAAVQGHHRAQFDLGLLYEQGEGVPRNPDAAVAWFREAADSGLSAAATRLKVLEATAQKRPAGQLSGVTLVSPARDATFSLNDDHPTVELVWVAPPEPQPVHYEIEVRELGGSSLTAIVTASVTETATVVHLPAKPDFYVWNVDTIGQDGSHAQGDWSWFSTGSPVPSQQSVASMPRTSIPVH